MSKVPYTLSAMGYVLDESCPKRLVNKNGHPFYPVVLKDDLQHSEGYWIELALQAAFDAGANPIQCIVSSDITKIEPTIVQVPEKPYPHKTPWPL